ncbi:MAG: ABC transporter permease subunit [Clostridium sp.]|uniref:ABC transporter permease subunit n=1 Tax=Clostridium sp. TaxID=1506 RepID=UPI003D6C96AB
MLNLVRNEMIKLIHSKKYIIFLCFIILILIFKGFNIYNSALKFKPETRIKDNQQILLELKTSLAGNTLSKEKKSNYVIQIKSLEEENKVLKYEMSTTSTDWKLSTQKRIQALKESKENSSMALDENRLEETDAQIKYYNYYLENSIEPPKAYQVTAHKDIIKMLSFMNVIFLPLLITFLCSDIISGEHASNTIKMLLTKPVKRTSIFNSKFIGATIVCISTICILEMVAFLILGIMFKFGNPLYPTIIGTRYTLGTSVFTGDIQAIAIRGTSYILPVWKVSVITALYQILYIMICVIFSMAISTFFISNILSLITSVMPVAFLSLITFMTPLGFLSKVYPLLFTTFSNPLDLLTGDLAMKLSNPLINFKTGIFVIIVWGIICYSLSLKKFAGRDVLA